MTSYVSAVSVAAQQMNAQYRPDCMHAQKLLHLFCCAQAIHSPPHQLVVDHRFDYANKAALDLFEAKWEELVGQPSTVSTEDVDQASMCSAFCIFLSLHVHSQQSLAVHATESEALRTFCALWPRCLHSMLACCLCVWHTWHVKCTGSRQPHFCLFSKLLSLPQQKKHCCYRTWLKAARCTYSMWQVLAS